MCSPGWFVEFDFKKEKCPYGIGLPGDITLPDGAGFVQYVCVGYGYVVFVIGGIAILELLIERDTCALSFVAFILTMIITGELIFKRIPAFQQRRPLNSCSVSCGMPSSHATFSIGFATFCLLETIRRVNFPTRSPQRTRQSIMRRTGGYLVGDNLRCDEKDASVVGVHDDGSLVVQLEQNKMNQHQSGGVLRTFPWRYFFTAVPMLKIPQASRDVFLIYCFWWALLMLPVGISRIVVHDHTPEQVLVGSFIGWLEALIWCSGMQRFWSSEFVARRIIRDPSAKHGFGIFQCGFLRLKHNYPACETGLRHALGYSRRESDPLHRPDVEVEMTATRNSP